MLDGQMSIAIKSSNYIGLNLHYSKLIQRSDAANMYIMHQILNIAVQNWRRSSSPDQSVLAISFPPDATSTS